jgi:hypothetical protein
VALETEVADGHAEAVEPLEIVFEPHVGVFDGQAVSVARNLIANM